MVPWMRGEGLTREERNHKMCIGAKICSGKAENEKEAEAICSIPKPPKERKKRAEKTNTCVDDVINLAHCMVDNIDMNQASNINSIEPAIINSMLKCKCNDEE